MWTVGADRGHRVADVRNRPNGGPIGPRGGTIERMSGGAREVAHGAGNGRTTGAGELWLTVLGPVRLWSGPDERELGGLQRALLALLAVRVGHPVMVADIVDVLWGARPPRSAVNSVHRYVGELRRGMEPGLRRREQGSRVVRAGGGYVLLAGAGELDLLRFRGLVEQATAARESGDAVVALRLLVAALRLWQGRCAANLSYRLPGRSTFAVIDAEMVAAVCAAADVALAVGRPHDVIELLRRAAGWERLDESVHARLLLVLAAAGRQAEALAHYVAIRQRLGDDLGVDPGIELRSAYQRVLRQDVGGPWPTTEPGGLTG